MLIGVNITTIRTRFKFKKKEFEEFMEFGLNRYKQHWLVFGEGVQPHADKACGKNTMNERHRQFLKELKKRGLIGRLEGLSFYSWKDTGAMELFKKKVDILEIMRQLRHKRLDTTQAYCNSLYVINKEIKSLDNNILPNNIAG